MRALRYDRYGPPDVLRVDELLEPSPAQGCAKIRVHAVGLNPVDWKIVAGHLPGASRRACDRAPAAGDRGVQGISADRAADELRTRLARGLSPRRRLRRPHPEWRPRPASVEELARPRDPGAFCVFFAHRLQSLTHRSRVLRTLRSGLAALRAPHTAKETTMIRKSASVDQSRKARSHNRLGSIVRARIAAAFRKFAHGVDARTAALRTLDFYRSSGTAWSRCLK